VRQYQPIWEQIKATLSCDISAHRAHHLRIIKAVVKEKDMDTLYKLERSESYTRAILTSKRVGAVIHFKLTLRPYDTLEESDLTPHSHTHTLISVQPRK
jgi:hypothetical protein